MSTANVWIFRTRVEPEFTAAQNVVGYDVEATDGHIGKIDEASLETSHRFLVVDTGFWIFGKKRLIPAGVVTNVDHEKKNVYVALTKDELKRAPDYDAQVTQDDEAYYDKQASYYSPYGW